MHEGLTERLAITPNDVGKRKFPPANKVFAAGRLSGREEARSFSVLESAERAYTRFAKAKPFWR